ncbi:MAG: ABC transporter ATP-binding protein [Wenzhouxiangellaceae bacterium]|nr:ABC transporter ATP-binding protein [Wenzhouxiangellaceae bacterium]
MESVPLARPVVLLAADVAFSFADRLVLDAVSLAIERGEIVALLGPNGAGKSTLIRCICGRLAPAAGQVAIDGRDPRRDRAARARLGLVPQRIGVYEHLTVAENLAAFGRLSGVDRARLDEAVQATLARCALEAVANQRAATLSGGWQRRLNIACAIVHQPALLVLDEPTVGIDPPACAAIEQLLLALAADGVAILMTSHDLAQLERIAGRVAFLADGRIVEDGEPAALLDRHFADRVECRVRLSSDAPSAASVLQHAGLDVDAGDPLLWAGLLTRARADTLAHELSSVTELAELRIRRPGLDALWRAHYSEAPSIAESAAGEPC